MPRKYSAQIHDQDVPIEVDRLDSGQIKIRSGDREWCLDVHQAGPHHYSIIQDGKSYDLRFFHAEAEVSAFYHGECIRFRLEDARKLRGTSKSATLEGPIEVRSQMPGKIVSVKVAKGDSVEEGQALCVLEAMKMENEMSSPKKGKVTAVNVSEGQSVESGTVLVVIE